MSTHDPDDALAVLAAYRTTPTAEATALPPDLYRSERLLTLELEHVFRGDWVCIGRTDQLATVGDYFTTTVAGEPIVVTHDESGTLRALSAVCRHRYASVAEGRGNSRRLVCPYHRWSYALDGELRGAPLMELPTGPDGEPCRLPEFSIETWLGFVFVNLESEPAELAPQLVGAAEQLAPYQMDTWRSLIHFDEVWDGNWKLAMETALEGYHLDGLHRGELSKMLPSRGARFVQATERWSEFRLTVDFESALGAPTKPFADAMGGEDATASPTVSVHPHVNISCGPASTVWLSFLPLDVDRTHVIGAYLVPPSEYERIQADPDELAFTHEAIAELNRQDASATVIAQRNLTSRTAVPGQLNEREEALIHFYRYLANRLTANAEPAGHASDT